MQVRPDAGPLTNNPQDLAPQHPGGASSHSLKPQDPQGRLSDAVFAAFTTRKGKPVLAGSRSSDHRMITDSLRPLRVLTRRLGG